MIKELLRSVGIGCLLAGGILYTVSNIPQVTEESLKKELTATQKELEVVKKELAISQTLTSEEQPDNQSKPDVKPVDQQKRASEKDIETTVITKKIAVQSGSSSADLSSTLERAHLISDATKFDAYMKENGYAGKIQIGTFELRSDMSFEEIANVLTK
ncbi:endolytic transglycosylase MltG [Sporosarcina obsidiansis]|uniref:endolytic transglycosylase MltG n=1 Tax=Sporosarcina obsidiansis TaxID=2660748 RepID=UPI00129B2CF2|nr:endolytic transglycosylase MltG [Sporosarcina obsidiansis]